jgi:hypothetical protein
MALAVAVFALVVIGALVAGSFFGGRLEQQSGQNTLYAAQAAEAAEAGLTDAMASLTPPVLQAATVGTPVSLTTLTVGSGLVASRDFVRLTDIVFLLRSTGTRRNAGGTAIATRKAGSLVRLSNLDLTVKGGLTALGQVTVTGNATVSGNDEIPAAWTDPDDEIECPATDNQAGVRYNGTLTEGGSSEIYGDPRTELDPTLGSGNLLGGTNFQELKGLKTLTLTSSSIAGLAPALTATIPPRCNTAVQNNWGAPLDPAALDPFHACFDYFPIIYRNGDLSMSGAGAGQGILLVEGNLTIQGQIQFFGPIIASGSVRIRGTGSDNVKLIGGVIANMVDIDDSQLTGNATVLYSSCAVMRALKGSALVKPVAERGWVQLY